MAVIEDNPYTLLRVAPDMLFGTADTLAEHLGITGSDSRRLEAGLEWILRSLDNQGHTCLPVDQLIGRLDDLLQTDADDIANFIEGLLEQGALLKACWNKVHCIVRIMKISYIFTLQKCTCLK